MIKKLVLKNIESHQLTKINFQNTNAIVGSSDTGKSALFRALQSFFFFKPIGTRYNEEDSSIKIETSENVIERKRSDEVKYYCLLCQYEDKQQFAHCPKCQSKKIEIKRKKSNDQYIIDGVPNEKLGKGYSSLPDDIKKLFPLFLLELQDGKLVIPGFRGQHEDFIFEQLSPAELNQVFSILEGNDIVDELNRFIRKDILKTKRTLNIHVDECKLLASEVDNQEKSFAGIEKDYVQTEDTFKHADELMIKYLAMVKKCVVLDKDEKEIKAKKLEVDSIEKKEVSVDEILPLIEKFEKLNGYVIRLKKVIKPLKDFRVQLSELPKCQDIPAAQELLEKHTKMMLSYKKVLSLDSKISSLRISLTDITKEEENCKEIISKSKMELCPYSGEPIAEGCKKFFEANHDEGNNDI